MARKRNWGVMADSLDAPARAPPTSRSSALVSTTLSRTPSWFALILVFLKILSGISIVAHINKYSHKAESGQGITGFCHLARDISQERGYVEPCQ
jgi:hypothetical protein